MLLFDVTVLYSFYTGRDLIDLCKNNQTVIWGFPVHMGRNKKDV